MEKYKVTNKLEQSLNYGKITFKAKETKILDSKPSSDKFIVEIISEVNTEKKEKKITKLKENKK